MGNHYYYYQKDFATKSKEANDRTFVAIDRKGLIKYQLCGGARASVRRPSCRDIGLLGCLVDTDLVSASENACNTMYYYSVNHFMQHVRVGFHPGCRLFLPGRRALALQPCFVRLVKFGEGVSRGLLAGDFSIHWSELRFRSTFHTFCLLLPALVPHTPCTSP
jgi:hypothetical protein